MSKLDKLFSPISFGQLELKNRIIMLGMGTYYGNAEDGHDACTARLINYFAERAKGGAALISTPFTVLYQGNNQLEEHDYFAYHLPGMYDDKLIPGIRNLADAVHANGSKSMAQLQIHDKFAVDNDSPLEYVSPSGIVKRKGPEPRELTIPEIEQIVEAYGEAARRAREGGCDAVEIYAGMGFLLSQFLSRAVNKRTDKYGGGPEGRAQIVVEIIESIRKRVGKDYPVSCRFSGVDLVDGGNEVEDAKIIGRVLEQAGIDMLNVQAGWLESRVPIINQWVEPGAFVYVAEAVKQVVNVPVVAAYRINDPILANNILSEGRADVIGMGRALIADPEFPNKAREGRISEIRKCIACLRCIDLVHNHPDVLPMACTVNYRAGREGETIITPAKEPKKVLVIGGGPAGMQAAITATDKGHKVTLVDQSRRLGGAMLAAGILNPQLPNLRKYMEAEVQKRPIEVKLKTEVTTSFVQQINPDVTIIAAGGEPPAYNIPGVKGPNVLSGRAMFEAIAMNRVPGNVGSGHKILWRLALLATGLGYHPGLINYGMKFGFPFGKRVVVLGGGFAGFEVSDVLGEKGKKVTILEEGPQLGYGIGISNIWVLIKRLRKFGVAMEKNVKIEKITDKGVEALVGDERKFYEADTVMLARPFKAKDDALKKELEVKGLEAIVIGDAADPQKIMEAVATGFRAGFDI